MKAPTQQLGVDWYEVLWDLTQRGFSFLEVERKTGIAETTLRGYRDGSHPVHWRGELLVELWCGVCGKVRADLPMAPLVLSPRVVEARPKVQEQSPIGLEVWARAAVLDRIAQRQEEQPLLVTADEAARQLSISTQTLRDMRKREGFPAPVEFGTRPLRWRRADLEAYISTLPRLGPQPEPANLTAARLARKGE